VAAEHVAHLAIRARGAMPMRSHAAMHSPGTEALPAARTEDRGQPAAQLSGKGSEAALGTSATGPPVSEVRALGYLSSNEVRLRPLRCS
jgi:hypothetical protein